MGDVELRADFDRDGRLSGSSTEYAARMTVPGAIIGINIDRDGRALPKTAGLGKPVALDQTMSTKNGQDGEPLPLNIVVSANAAAQFTSLTLRVAGSNAEAVGLIDERAHVVTPAQTQAGQVDFPLPLRVGTHRFKLEASRVPGSPLGAGDGALTLSIVGLDSAGNAATLDSGRFLLACFIVLDDLSPAQHLYMADLTDNRPAISDVREALAGVSPAVDLRVVPIGDNMGDGWLQDQFQMGYIITPAGTMPTILHMPRLANIGRAGESQSNLAQFVRTHFPSTDLGLMEDFWQRKVPLAHLGGTTPVTFQVSEEGNRLLSKIDEADRFLSDAIKYLCRMAKKRGIVPETDTCDQDQPSRGSTSLTLLGLPDQLLRLDEFVAKLVAGAEPTQATSLRSLGARARARVQAAQQALPFSMATDELAFEMRLSVQTFLLNEQQVDDFHKLVGAMHDSLVYGGNIEASPALSGHPFGKVVIGESKEREMDPDVRKLFTANAAVQPVVTIDTSWLKVGHVDELIAFLPDRRDKQKHVILRASPEVASALMDVASDLYKAGLPFNHPDINLNWSPARFVRHFMDSGPHPVTRLFRGKLWRHAHPRSGPPGSPEPSYGSGGQRTGGSGQPVDPPLVYKNIAEWHSSPAPWSSSVAPYTTESKQDADYYSAALSMWEFTSFEEAMNETIVKEKLGTLDTLLAKEEFPELQLLKLPVLFDTAPKLSVGAIAAFSPDLVNLQHVNGTVLISHPFGPRMLPDDALQVIREVTKMQGLDKLAGNLSVRFFERNRLNVTEVWVNRQVEAGRYEGPLKTVQDLALEFKDGFPGVELTEIEERIRKANRTHFDASGGLKDGWRKILIPESMVDLFQAYTHLILQSLDLSVRWIDSWYYHVHTGGIHCGTNVLRAVPDIRTPWWSRIKP